MRIPVNQPYVITTEFGVPDSNALFGRHSGIDYAGFGAGRPVYAPASGTLTNIDSRTGGNMVVIFDGNAYHRLMHNSSFSRGNGPVAEGDEVARAGTTGLSTGVHCHWDVNTQGVFPTSFGAFINPMEYIKQGDVMEPLVGYDTANQIHQDYTGRDWGEAAWKSWSGGGKTLSATLDNVRHSQARKDYVNYIANLEKNQSGEYKLAGSLDGKEYYGKK